MADQTLTDRVALLRVGSLFSGYDGLGDWNIPWETWSKGNVNETSAW